MFKRFALLLLPVLAFAQLTPNSVTVNAARPAAAAPDTVRFTLTVNSTAAATRDDIVSALSGVGVTAANFTGLYTYSSIGNFTITWNFSITAPLSSMKATIAQLTALQNSLEAEKKYSLSYSVAGSEVSVADCKLSDLIADARAQAAKLASAAGMGVGAIQAINGSTTSATAAANGIASASTVSSPACSVTVRFGLTGGL